MTAESDPAPDPALDPDDRWGYRALRAAFLAEFGAPGTPAGDRMEKALSGVTDALLRETRYHATWPVATAEKWRYDRMQWVFGVMLGEIDPDSQAPAPEDYDPRDGTRLPDAPAFPVSPAAAESATAQPNREQ